MLSTAIDAQTMSFSVYNNWSVSSDGTTFYNGGSVIDNSSGCSHTGYETTATVGTPDYRSASAQSYGLTSNTSIATDDLDGTYTVSTNGTYHCSCINSYAGFGGGFSIPIKKTIYSLSYQDPCGCDYVVNCGKSTGTCTAGVYSTTSLSSCGCGSIAWIKIYYWYNGGGVCTPTWTRYNTGDRTYT